MAKKSSSGPVVINDQSNAIRVQSSRAPMPPGSMQKSADIYAPVVPVTGNSEQSGDITSNPYRPDDAGLLGGASSPPSASDIVHPTSDELKPGPGVGLPRPDIA
jgi:hypothetical protein